MTAGVHPRASGLARVLPSRRAARVRREATPVPPLDPRLHLVRTLLVVLVILTVSVCVHLLVVSRLQHRSAQEQRFDHFRAELAEGTAPTGPEDADGEPLEIGRSVAYMEIRSIGLQEVIVEGTTAGALFDGPGHRRDTPLPGQIGTSIVMGRRTTYGGPFADLERLKVGDVITVGTGQGVFDFSVTGLRREGDPLPPTQAAGTARLTLVTTDGSRWLPSGLLRIDAELIGDPVVGAARLFTSTSLPESERAMEGDASTIWVLLLWLQALLVLVVAAVWAWLRWGRAEAWVVFVPPLALVGISASAEFVKLLPNLI